MGEKRIDELNDAQYPSYYHYLPIDRDVAAETAKLKADYFGRANDSSDIRCLGNTNTTGAIIPSGKYFYKYDSYHSNRALAKAISNIAVNATLTENTNFKYVTIGEELDSLNAALLNYCKFKHLYSGTSNIYSKTIDLSEYDAVMLGVGYSGRVYATSIINKGTTGSIEMYMGWDASNRFIGGADFTISDNGIAVGSARYSLINASGSSNFTETTNSKVAIYEIYGIKY